MTRPVEDNQEDIVKEAVRKFVDARWQDHEPDIDEFLEQYPGLEHQIRQGIRDAKRIDALFDSLVQADQSDFENSATEHDLVGHRLASFDVEKVIGRGGMGVVYLARDTKLDRHVAIKSMPGELLSSTIAQVRFRREAKLLASLNHPNIAAIYDIVEQDEGAGYLILEYIPGETLTERIAREPLKLEEALSIGRQIAEAVSAAHEKGVVHRDLKPGNTKITPDGRVKVLDFGLAKATVSEGTGGKTTETQPGHVIGTPAYMSPEQARGKATDHHTDIWSFGCIMYQMLTGNLPFEGETATDTLARIIEREPDWKMLPRETPTSMRVLLRHCLEKNPDRRLGDIADAGAEISKVLRRSATEASLPVKLRRTTMIIGAAIIIVLSCIVAWFALNKQAQPSSNQIRLAVLPFRYHGPAEQEWFADSMTDEITTCLTYMRSLHVIPYQTAIQYKNKDISIQQIGKDLNVDYILEGAIQRKQPSDPNSPAKIQINLIKADDETAVWPQPYDHDVDDTFDLQSEIAELVARALDITLLEPERQALAFRPTESKKAYEYYCSGKVYYNRGDFRRAIKLLDEAVELDFEFALAYAQLSRAHSSTYWTDPNNKTQACLDKAKEAVLKAQEFDPDLPEVHLALGHYYYHGLRKYDDALKEFGIVLRTQPDNDEALAFTCYVQRKQGKIEEALANIKKASEINPINRQWAMDIPEILIVLERYEEAVDACDRAIELYPGRAHPYRVKAWVYLYWKGSIDKARNVLQEASRNVESPETEYEDILSILDTFEGNYPKALDRISSTPDRKGPFLPRVLRIAQIYGYMNQKKLANEYYEKARMEFGSEIQRDSEDGKRHGFLGIAYAGLGREEEAIREGERAMTLHPITLDAFYHPQVSQLAYIYLMVGAHKEAIDQLEFLLTNPDHWSVPFIKIDPTWTPLHYHPRFQKLTESDKRVPKR